MSARARGAALGLGLLALGADQSDPIRASLLACGVVAVAAARLPLWSSLPLAVGAAAATAAQPSPAAALAAGLGWLAAHRALSAKGKDRGTTLVSALAIVAGVSGGPDPVPWLAAIAWAGVLPLALAVGPRRGRATPAWLPVASILATLGFYLALPRLRDVTVREDAPPMTGFAPEVVLDRSEGPADQAEIMLRVRPAGAGALYLRGMVLDRFDGRKWYTEVDPRPAESPRGGVGTRLEVVATRPESAAFTAGDPHDIRTTADLLRTSAGTWMFADPVWGWSFVASPPLSVRVRSAGSPPRDEDRALPPDLDPRVRAFGRGLGEGRAAVEEGLRRLSGWRYSREATRVTADPLGTFLFERRAGHCEHFASALAVLLRASGLPTRVITGYATAEIDRDAWIVRRRNAHAWVEVWVEGAWESVDATPGPLAPSVAPPRLDPQRAFDAWSDWDRDAWSALARAAAPFCLAMSLGAATLALIVRYRPRIATAPSDPVERAHWRARRRLASLGWEVPRSLPPVAAAQWIAARADDPEAAQALLALAWLLYHRRWGTLDPVPAGREAAALQERAARIGPPPPKSTTTEARRPDAERVRDHPRL